MTRKLVISIILSLLLLMPFKAFALDPNPQGDETPLYIKEALSKEGLSMEDINKFTTYYYLNPQPDKLIRTLKFFLNQEQMLTDPIHLGPMEHLVATVAHEDKAVLNSLKLLKGQYSGMQNQSIGRIIDQAENFISPNPDSAKNLDYLWAEFFATGKDEPVKKIISVLNYSARDLEAGLLIGTAEWSLASNAKEHKKVYGIIQMEYIDSKDKAREKLLNILQKVEAAEEARAK